MKETDSQPDPMKQANWALGLFLLFFGLVVLLSVIFTETTPGMVANIASGLVIAGIGLGMMLTSRTRSGTS
jgi:hypothetical protein